MSRKFWAAVTVAATTVTLMAVGSGSASASDVATSGCTRLFAEYTSNANGVYLSYLEATNICAPYAGFFTLDGVEGPHNNPIQTFRHQFNQQINRGRGGESCAVGYERKPGGGYVQRGEACIRYP